MGTERLTEWYAPIITHSHTWLGGIHPGPEVEDEADWHEGQFSTEALSSYLEQFAGDAAGYVLCDTDHPYQTARSMGHHLLAEDLQPDRIERTIATLSDSIARRADTIRRRFPRGEVLTGVEADIVGPDGRLDISQEVLQSLDFVIASFHCSHWVGHCGAEPSQQDFFEALANVTANPHVDVLGHPFRLLEQREFADDVRVEDWDPVLENMCRNGSAFEISYPGFITGREFGEYERSVLIRAVQRGVRFVVGADFHTSGRFLPGIPETRVDSEDVEAFFTRAQGSPHLQLFMRLGRLQREMAKLGIRKEQVINRDVGFFKEWVRERSGNTLQSV